MLSGFAYAFGETGNDNAFDLRKPDVPLDPQVIYHFAMNVC